MNIPDAGAYAYALDGFDNPIRLGSLVVFWTDMLEAIRMPQYKVRVGCVVGIGDFPKRLHGRLHGRGTAGASAIVIWQGGFLSRYPAGSLVLVQKGDRL